MSHAEKALSNLRTLCVEYNTYSPHMQVDFFSNFLFHQGSPFTFTKFLVNAQNITQITRDIDDNAIYYGSFTKPRFRDKEIGW